MHKSSIGYNGFTLGEGGDFNHKCRCGEQMLNIAVNVERSTAPPLLPNVCYGLVLILDYFKCLHFIFTYSKKIYSKWKFIYVNTYDF